MHPRQLARHVASGASWCCEVAGRCPEAISWSSIALQSLRALRMVGAHVVLAAVGWVMKAVVMNRVAGIVILMNISRNPRKMTKIRDRPRFPFARNRRVDRMNEKRGPSAIQHGKEPDCCYTLKRNSPHATRPFIRVIDQRARSSSARNGRSAWPLACLLGARPPADRGHARAWARPRSRTRWPARSAWTFSASSSPATCCPPTSSACRSSTATPAASVPSRPDLLAADPGRRDQPRHAQDAERAAGSDGRAPGHRRRRDAPAARAVLRHRHAESLAPDRHLPAARIAARPLPDAHRTRLSGPRRRARAAAGRGAARPGGDAASPASRRAN